MGLQFMPGSEPMQMNINPPSEVVMRELGLVESFEAVEPNGPSPSFKDGEEVLTPELTKLLVLIRAREEIAKEWFESVIVTNYNKGSRSPHENHRGISSVRIEPKVLMCVIFY